MSMVGKARARPDQVRKVLDTVAQQGAIGHLQEGHEPARLLHPARLLAVRRGDRGGAGRRGVPRRPARRGGGQRVRPARRVQLGPGQPVRARSRGASRPSTPPSPPWGRSPCTACGAPRPSSATRRCVIGLGLIGQLVVRLLVAAGVRVIGLDVIEERCRLAEQAGAVLCAAPDRRGHGRRPGVAGRDLQRPRRRPRVPGRGRILQRAGRDRGQAGQGPRPRGRHRQDPPGPAVERLLRQGARRPVLPVLRARAGTTSGTSSRASTTRPATSAGPSAATWNASSTSSRARTSRSRR